MVAREGSVSSMWLYAHCSGTELHFGWTVMVAHVDCNILFYHWTMMVWLMICTLHRNYMSQMLSTMCTSQYAMVPCIIRRLYYTTMVGWVGGVSPFICSPPTLTHSTLPKSLHHHHHHGHQHHPPHPSHHHHRCSEAINGSDYWHHK